MQTWIGRLVAVALALLIALAGPSAGQDTVIKPDAVAAFVKRNLSLMTDGQIYVGAPYVRAVDESIDDARVTRDVQQTTPGGYVDGPPAPNVILISRNPEDFATAFAAYSHEMTSSGFDQAEAVRLWSTLLVARGDCNVEYPREYMAVISVDPAIDVAACVHESIYWFRGRRIPFHEFASIVASDATRLIDDQLAIALGDCAPLGWLDRGVRDCVQSRFPPDSAGRDVRADRPRPTRAGVRTPP